jgi:hypothetical protein
MFKNCKSAAENRQEMKDGYQVNRMFGHFADD